MNILRTIGKPFAKRLRAYIRERDDSKVPSDYVLNVKIEGDGLLELNLCFPENVKSLRFDIGLSHNAPNSAKWLRNRDDLFVVGVEANRFNAHKLVTNGMWSKNDPKSLIRPYKSKNFHILYCAIDDVVKPCYSKFYHVKGDAGTSSLLEPTERLLKDHDYAVKNISEVPTIPLSSILKQVPWDRFEYIEVCKVDTQGKDLDVLKSAGNYLNKIALLSVEVDTFGQYHGAAKREDIYSFMERSGFYEAKVLTNVENEVVDVLFANRVFEKYIPGLLDSV